MRDVFLDRYISHEMRTPLSAAAMGLSLLQDDMLDDDDGAGASLLDQHGDVLRMVQTSFKKAETICADLLQVPHCLDKSFTRRPLNVHPPRFAV